METRNKLLDAAEACLIEKGSNGTSVKAIAAAAGVNHGLVHHYFGSKEGLFIELLRRQFDRIALPPREELSDPDDFTAYFRDQLFPNFRIIFEMRALAFHMPGLHWEMLRNARRVRNLMGEYFHIEDQGKLMLFVSIITGLELQYSIDPEIDIRECMIILLKMLNE